MTPFFSLQDPAVVSAAVEAKMQLLLVRNSKQTSAVFASKLYFSFPKFTKTFLTINLIVKQNGMVKGHMLLFVTCLQV